MNQLYFMETDTVKLLKALPNMLRKVMPTVVVATKYSQGKKDLGDPYTMAPFGFELGFYYFIFLRCLCSQSVTKGEFLGKCGADTAPFLF